MSIISDMLEYNAVILKNRHKMVAALQKEIEDEIEDGYMTLEDFHSLLEPTNLVSLRQRLFRRRKLGLDCVGGYSISFYKKKHSYFIKITGRTK